MLCLQQTPDAVVRMMNKRSYYGLLQKYFVFYILKNSLQPTSIRDTLKLYCLGRENFKIFVIFIETESLIYNNRFPRTHHYVKYKNCIDTEIS